MGRISKQERVKLWLDRLNRQSSSGESIGKFCAGEGISVPSFYQWKRRLALSVVVPVKTRANRRPGNQPAHVAKASFAEIQVVDQPSSATVSLPGGISIGLGHDPQIVGNIIDRVLRHSLGDHLEPRRDDRPRSTESES